MDANVLFSAAWRADVSPALSLWALTRLTLVSSAYAIDEAKRNLDTVDSRARLYRLIARLEITDEAPATVMLPNDVELAPKDQPILRAAIHAHCTHLLTGDRRHFGELFGRSIEGVRVMTVREYLTARGIRDE